MLRLAAVSVTRKEESVIEKRLQGHPPPIHIKRGEASGSFLSTYEKHKKKATVQGKEDF